MVTSRPLRRGRPLPFAFRIERARSRVRVRASLRRLDVASARARVRFLERRREEFPLSRAELRAHETLYETARAALARAERRLARALAVADRLAAAALARPSAPRASEGDSASGSEAR